MSDKPSDNTKQSNAAVGVLANGYIFASYAAIVTLFVFGIQWFIKVMRAARPGGETT